MSPLTELTEQLTRGADLEPVQAEAAAKLLPSPEIEAPLKQDFLVALHAKGETVAEVSAFARVFRELATNPGLEDLAGSAIDIVGTGGSGSHGFNISSTTALLLAASGVCVLKHGNRAITSKSGAADFLGQLGISMEADPARLRAAATELNFCFFFAPAFHPAFKEIMPVRKAMAAEGKRSIFNILGPLINPAKPTHQLLGVFHPDWVAPLALALHELGMEAGLAVASQLPQGGYMDELTTAGPNTVAGFGRLKADPEVWEAASAGLPIADPADLRGGTAEENIECLKEMMAGRGPEGLVNSILFNAAAAYTILDAKTTLADGAARARETLLGGDLKNWLQKARDFYGE
jgi:anthranilate phosphoribosyltransferase